MLPFAFLVELPSRNMVGLILFTMHKVRHGDSEEEDDETGSDERPRRSGGGSAVDLQRNNFFLSQQSSNNLAIRETREVREHVGGGRADKGAYYYINEGAQEGSSSFVSDFKKA